jgi:uncharacterized membrane protein
MNSIHFHLITNHFPIIVPIIALLVMLGGFLFRSAMIKRTALALFVFGAISTFPAMYSGDKAEDLVEKIPGITHDIIEIHEKSAEQFAVWHYGLGLLALLALWSSWKNHKTSQILTILVIIYACVMIYFGNKTATTGGEIRHTEIRIGYEPEPIR